MTVTQYVVRGRFPYQMALCTIHHCITRLELLLRLANLCIIGLDVRGKCFLPPSLGKCLLKSALYICLRLRCLEKLVFGAVSSANIAHRPVYICLVIRVEAF